MDDQHQVMAKAVTKILNLIESCNLRASGKVPGTSTLLILGTIDDQQSVLVAFRLMGCEVK